MEPSDDGMQPVPPGLPKQSWKYKAADVACSKMFKTLDECLPSTQFTVSGWRWFPHENATIAIINRVRRPKNTEYAWICNTESGEPPRKDDLKLAYLMWWCDCDRSVNNEAPAGNHCHKVISCEICMNSARTLFLRAKQLRSPWASPLCFRTSAVQSHWDVLLMWSRREALLLHGMFATTAQFLKCKVRAVHRKIRKTILRLPQSQFPVYEKWSCNCNPNYPVGSK